MKKLASLLAFVYLTYFGLGIFAATPVFADQEGEISINISIHNINDAPSDGANQTEIEGIDTWVFGPYLVELFAGEEPNEDALITTEESEAMLHPVGSEETPDSKTTDVFFVSDLINEDEDYTVCIASFRQSGEFSDDEACETGRKGSGPMFLDLNFGAGDRVTNIEPVTSASEADANCKGVVLSWLICHVIELAFDAIATLYGELIAGLLVIDPINNAADPDTPEAVIYEMWNTFRIIALVVFVIVFGLAIFANAFSFALSPYEVKKILPRIVIGIIGASLSWYIVGYLVDITNIAGAGVRALMLAPAEGIDLEINLNYESITQDILANIGIASGATIAAYLVGLKGLITGLPIVLLPIVLALVAVVITLILRKVLIFGLIVISPLAFVMWILPNTSSLFKTWWSFLSKALFMYPLIVALLSSGELMAKVINAQNTSRTGESQSIWVSIVGLIALFAPFFFIPLTFKFAGGAIAGIQGKMGTMSKRLSQRWFGEDKDPDSYRGKRKAQMRARRTRYKTRAMSRAEGKPGWRRPASTATSRFINRFGRGTLEDMAEMQAQSSKEISDLVSNARDEYIYAMLGDHNIITGKRLSQEAINYAKATGARKDMTKVTGALNYAMTKAGSTQEMRQIQSNWANVSKMNKLGIGLSPAERDRAFDRAGNMGNMKALHGDLSFRDYNNQKKDASGNVIGYNMHDDRRARARFVRESTDKTGYDMTKQRESYWQGMNEVVDDHRVDSQALQAAATGSGYDASRLAGTRFVDANGNINQDAVNAHQELTGELRRMQAGMDQRDIRNAPVSANDEHKAVLRNLNDMKGSGLL